MKLGTLIKKLLRRDLESMYVSDADKLLTEFDAAHPQKSDSQQHEINKFKRIFYLRDNPEPRHAKSEIWEGF